MQFSLLPLHNTPDSDGETACSYSCQDMTGSARHVWEVCRLPVQPTTCWRDSSAASIQQRRR